MALSRLTQPRFFGKKKSKGQKKTVTLSSGLRCSFWLSLIYDLSTTARFLLPLQSAAYLGFVFGTTFFAIVQYK